MRSIDWVGAGLFSWAMLTAAWGQQFVPASGPDWRIRPVISVDTNDQGIVSFQTNTVVELSGGMNRWDDALGQWLAVEPSLVSTDEGGVLGKGARHSVHFAPNINSAEAVQIQFRAQDGPKWLKMHFLGLFYEDPVLRTNVLIADLQDCPAQVVGQQVQYRDAFSGLSADIAYSYTALGISQVILFREPLPDPLTYGLSSGSLRLVAISEIAQGPEPELDERSWLQGGQTEKDQSLDFGGMRMVPGRAFRLGGAPDWQSSIPVLKEYRTQKDGRRLILERLPFQQVQNQLLKLPPINLNTNGTAGLKKTTPLIAGNTLPVRPKTAKSVVRSAQNILAQTDGFVLDWELVNTSLRDFTFRRSPGVSYVVLGDTRLAGTTTVNAGAVLRFDSGSLWLDGPLAVSDTALVPAGRKPLLTSIYDESAGPALRLGGPTPPGQYVPAMIVRADDYTNAVQLLEIRHPGARVIPDHPNGLDIVVLKRKARTGTETNQQASFLIQRLGGDLNQSLTVHLKTSTNTTGGFNPQGSSSTVTIPANVASVDVFLSKSTQAGPGYTELTLEPDPNGNYVPGEQLSVGFSTIASGTISPMSMQTPSGMVGWWKAEANANDSSGGNHSGTAKNGSTYASGWVGQTFSFDGIDDFIEVQSDPALQMSSAMTVEFWLKRQRLTGAYEYLIEKGGNFTGYSQNYAVQIHGPDNGLCFTWNWGYRIGGVINDLNWHHVSVTATNGQRDPILYIDGWPQTLSLDQWDTSVSLLSSSTLPLHIGAQIDPLYPFYSQTLIDEMSLYNQSLSQNQIQSIFNVGRAGKSPDAPICTAPQSGMVSWWRAENSANDSIGGNGGSFSGSYMGGQVGQTFLIDDNNHVTINSSPSLDVGAGSGFTIEGWINVYDEDLAGRPVFEWAGPTYGVHVWVNHGILGTVFVNIVDASGNNHYNWSSASIQSKTFQHLAVTYDRSSGKCLVYVNGTLVLDLSVGAITAQTSYPSYPLYLGYRPANLGGGPRSFKGVIDEVSLYSRALSQPQIQSIYTAQSAGKCIGVQSTPTVTVTASTPTAKESGLVPGVFTVSRQATDVSAALTVNFTLSGSTASSGSDYTSIGTSVTIPANQTSTTVIVTPLDDSLDEADETVVMTLAANGSAYNIGSPNIATVTILDKPTVTVTASTPTAKESGLVPGVFTVSRQATDVGAALTVNVTLSGSATPNSDYTAISSPVSIPAGQSSTTVNVTPLDDSLDEADETVVLTLAANGSAYNIGAPSRATVTILNRATVSVGVADPFVYENSSSGAQIIISRSGPAVNAALPVFFTLSGGAVNGVDFQSITSPVTIPQGASSKTISIAPIDNSTVNLARTVTFTLTPDSGYSVDANASAGTVEILDNELPSVTVSATDSSAQEPSNVGVFTLSRSQNVSQPLIVWYSLGGIARNGIDYQQLTGTATFDSGVTSVPIAIQPIDNATYDGIRDVVLTILPGLDYVDGTPATATVSLADNETQPVSVSATVSETREDGASPGIFRFVRDGSTRAPLNVAFVLSGAINGTDYQRVSSPLSFAADEREKMLSIAPINNSAVDGPRSVNLSIQAGSGYSVIPNRGSATVTIVNDDLPTVTVSAVIANASEGTTPIPGTFRLTRDGATIEALAVNYVLEGTAYNGVDYVKIGSQATIAAGHASVDVSISPIDNSLAEVTRSAILRLLPSLEYQISTPAYRATVNILDDEPLSYSWEATRPYAVASVNPGLGVPTQTGVPGELVIRRIGRLPTTAVNLTFDFLGGTPGYDHHLAMEGNVLTLVESETGGTVTLQFPALSNELHIPVGEHIKATKGSQVPFPNGAFYIGIPSLFGATRQRITTTHPTHVFKVAKIGDHIDAQGSAANLFRVSRSFTGTADVSLDVDLLVSGTASPGTDHNLPATKTVTFSTTDTYKDVSVTAYSDSYQPRGWKTIDVTLDPLKNLIVMDTAAGTSAQSFIREPSQPAGNAPVYSSDPTEDADLDGMTDPEELVYGSNTRLRDTNADGISDGAESGVCAKDGNSEAILCVMGDPTDGTRINQLFVGNVKFDRPVPSGLAERTYWFARGAQYPVRLRIESLHGDKNWYVAFGSSDGLPLDFLVNWVEPPPPSAGDIGTLIVPNLELTWVTKGDNTTIEDNTDPSTGQPMLGGGKRIYVGAKSPSDAANRRNTAMIKVKTTPPLPGKTVNLKAFDVDDTTDPGFDHNDQGLSVIDTNGDAGGDNYETLISSGKFFSNGQQSIAATLDAAGEALVEFEVGMQPGNNYRIAATVIPDSNLNSLQVNDPVANYYVPASGEKIRGGFDGALSPLLTVWRKLTLEFDSMSAAVGNARAGTLRKVIPGVPKSNQSTLIFDVLNPDVDHNELENGNVTIGGVSYRVLGNHKRGLYNSEFVMVDAVISVGAEGTVCTFVDDDESLLPQAGLPSGLPKLNDLPTILPLLQKSFTKADIFLVDGNAAGWNIRPTLPFHLNEPATVLFGSSFDDNQDLSDSANFWLHLVSFGYQPSPEEDQDPDNEPPLYGGTPKGQILNARFSVIYVESVREIWASENRLYVLPGPNQKLAEAQKSYWQLVAGDIAHETGHTPGGQDAEVDHSEGGQMMADFIHLEDYSAKTIRRFRHANNGWSP
jgi:hypothetical protein